jgi:hypothetical protein
MDDGEALWKACATVCGKESPVEALRKVFGKA